MAIATQQQTSTQLTNHLETVWRPRLALDTSEMMDIANCFESAGVERLGNSFVIRKVLPKTANAAAATAYMDSLTLTYEQEVETAITCSMTFIYSALSVTEIMEQRLLDSAQYSKAVREQFLRALPEYIDVQAGLLMDDLTQTVGSGAVSIDRTLLLQAMATLRQGAKREWEPGKPAFFRFHPKQIPGVYAIDAIMNANLRGDSKNPNVTGRVDGWNLDFSPSGNVASSGGAYHNPLFVAPAFVLGYNAKPQLEPPQRNGLATLLHGFADFTVTEVFDAYAVDVQSTTS
jgi:hypothetical protein